MTTRMDHGFTAFDEPPIRHGDTNHGDECECASCREVRIREYRRTVEVAEWAADEAERWLAAVRKAKAQVAA